MTASWSVYLLRCGDGTLYTGIATDVERRVAEHGGEGGKGAKYLRGRGPLELLLEREIGGRGHALRVERRVKRLSREGKRELVARRERMDELVAAAEAAS